MWITLRYEWSINPISLVYERTFSCYFYLFITIHVSSYQNINTLQWRRG